MEKVLSTCRPHKFGMLPTSLCLTEQFYHFLQVDNHPFNKGKLLNVGYNQSQMYDDYDCFVFHDVDLIPEDDRNDYGCPSSPRHMCPAVDKFGYRYVKDFCIYSNE